MNSEDPQSYIDDSAKSVRSLAELDIQLSAAYEAKRRRKMIERILYIIAMVILYGFIAGISLVEILDPGRLSQYIR